MIDRPGARPFRAVIYLPGHDDTGHGVPVHKIAARTRKGLDTACQKWRDQGYAVAAYEVIPLDLPGDTDSAHE